MEEKVDRELTVDQLTSGDRPSMYYFGMVGAHAIRKDQMAVFMTDVLGRVHLMNPRAIKVLMQPRLSDEELNQFEESEAINLMLKQGDAEDAIVEYLERRQSDKEPQ